MQRLRYARLQRLVTPGRNTLLPAERYSPRLVRRLNPNHSFPAPLKTAIDWYSNEWRGRPVAFVAYGGNAGGLRAVEQLRQVFAELHSVTVRDAVGFAGAWELFDATGQLRNPERHEKAANAMLDQLGWWANVLKEGRKVHPYPA